MFICRLRAHLATLLAACFTASLQCCRFSFRSLRCDPGPEAIADSRCLSKAQRMLRSSAAQIMDSAWHPRLRHRQMNLFNESLRCAFEQSRWTETGAVDKPIKPQKFTEICALRA